MELLIDKFYKFLRLDIYFIPSVVFLLIITTIFISKVEEKRKNKYFFIAILLLIAVFISRSIFFTRSQYLIWSQHPISRYLLPPYQKIDYFIGYAFSHFWQDFFFRLLATFFTFILISVLNFSLRRDVFYDDEKFLMFYITLAFFFPYNLLIIFTGFLMLLLVWVVNLIKDFYFPPSEKKAEKLQEILGKRISFRNYWLILAWLFLLIEPFFLTEYNFLKIRAF